MVLTDFRGIKMASKLRRVALNRKAVYQCLLLAHWIQNNLQVSYPYVRRWGHPHMKGQE